MVRQRGGEIGMCGLPSKTLIAQHDYTSYHDVFEKCNNYMKMKNCIVNNVNTAKYCGVKIKSIP